MGIAELLEAVGRDFVYFTVSEISQMNDCPHCGRKGIVNSIQLNIVDVVQEHDRRWWQDLRLTAPDIAAMLAEYESWRADVTLEPFDPKRHRYQNRHTFPAPKELSPLAQSTNQQEEV